MKKYAIILSAGKGTRMKSELPKGAFPILYRPMVVYAVENTKQAGFDKEVVVVGHKKEIIEEILNGLDVSFASQDIQDGTAKAVLASKDILNGLEGNTLIIPADMPLISKDLIIKAVNYHEESKNDLTVLTAIIDNPFSYGRIVYDKFNKVEKIVEEVDATPSEKAIKEVNSGVMIVNNLILFKELEKVKNDNGKKEYYLTDLVKIMLDDGFKVSTYKADDAEEIVGVNDLYMLSQAESVLRKRINKEYMIDGVNIINPDTVTIGPDVIIGSNVVIEPNTYIYGQSRIGSGSRIGPNSELKNAIIGENVWVRHSLVFDSTVNAGSTVGPFSHLRGGTVIGEKNRIGNFVELKNSTTKENTKASHLAYIGDATIGSNVNFGCGAITVNYDGKNKWATKIGNNSFIGSNCNLIAPINIEDGAFIAAGSTVNHNVPEGALAIARAKQVTKENYAEILRERAELKAKKKEEKDKK